jgi:hypothetical protein
MYILVYSLSEDGGFPPKHVAVKTNFIVTTVDVQMLVLQMTN